MKKGNFLENWRTLNSHVLGATTSSRLEDSKLEDEKALRHPLALKSSTKRVNFVFSTKSLL